MGPDSKSAIRWGVGTALAALGLVTVLAVVPDPFFRQQVFATTLDDVEGIQPGVKVFYRGAELGDVRSIDLASDSRSFDLRLGVDRNWSPSACTYMTVASSNPFTAPHIELVTLDASTRTCASALKLAQCEPVKAAAQARGAIVGCRRPMDLFQTAALAVSEAANVARTANQMAQRLQTMLSGSVGSGSPVDMATMGKNATDTLVALNSLTSRLDQSFAPGRGDLALTLSNVRQATGRVSQIDMASLNGILSETRLLVAQNQATIAGLLAEGQGTAAQAKLLLQDASASLVQTSANLQHTSENLGALTERLAADPTYAIRGQKYADPPAPGGK